MAIGLYRRAERECDDLADDYHSLATENHRLRALVKLLGRAGKGTTKAQKGDIAEAKRMAEELKKMGEEMKRLRGVVHSCAEMRKTQREVMKAELRRVQKALEEQTKIAADLELRATEVAAAKEAALVAAAGRATALARVLEAEAEDVITLEEARLPPGRLGDPPIGGVIAAPPRRIERRPVRIQSKGPPVRRTFPPRKMVPRRLTAGEKQMRDLKERIRERGLAMGREEEEGEEKKVEGWGEEDDDDWDIGGVNTDGLFGWYDPYMGYLDDGEYEYDDAYGPVFW